MAVSDVREPVLSGPSAVSVAHHRDVSRVASPFELPEQPPLVEPVQHATEPHRVITT
jgi:hypothetical protein